MALTRPGYFGPYAGTWTPTAGPSTLSHTPGPREVNPHLGYEDGLTARHRMTMPPLRDADPHYQNNWGVLPMPQPSGAFDPPIFTNPWSSDSSPNPPSLYQNNSGVSLMPPPSSAVYQPTTSDSSSTDSSPDSPYSSDESHWAHDPAIHHAQGSPMSAAPQPDVLDDGLHSVPVPTRELRWKEPTVLADQVTSSGMAHVPRKRVRQRPSSKEKRKAADDNTVNEGGRALDAGQPSTAPSEPNDGVQIEYEFSNTAGTMPKKHKRMKVDQSVPVEGLFCAICRINYTRTDSLNRHIKAKHPQQVNGAPKRQAKARRPKRSQTDDIEVTQPGDGAGPTPQPFTFSFRLEAGSPSVAGKENPKPTATGDQHDLTVIPYPDNSSNTWQQHAASASPSATNANVPPYQDDQPAYTTHPAYSNTTGIEQSSHYPDTGSTISSHPVAFYQHQPYHLARDSDYAGAPSSWTPAQDGQWHDASPQASTQKEAQNGLQLEQQQSFPDSDSQFSDVGHREQAMAPPGLYDPSVAAHQEPYIFQENQPPYDAPYTASAVPAGHAGVEHYTHQTYPDQGSPVQDTSADAYYRPNHEDPMTTPAYCPETGRQHQQSQEPYSHQEQGQHPCHPAVYGNVSSPPSFYGQDHGVDTSPHQPQMWAHVADESLSDSTNRQITGSVLCPEWQLPATQPSSQPTSSYPPLLVNHGGLELENIDPFAPPPTLHAGWHAAVPPAVPATSGYPMSYMRGEGSARSPPIGTAPSPVFASAHGPRLFSSPAKPMGASGEAYDDDDDDLFTIRGTSPA
ncbi:hypothetical protein FPV67DRAFT_1669615 [Lyophyllum atratum]|nr:hypothetical protein FPV67DRAFT_1669615 [Lyophyllum atratum]